MTDGWGRTPPLRKRNKMCRARVTARVAPTGAWQEVRCGWYYGCPCCGGQNFHAALRRTPPILTAASGSGPPSCQPIPGHCRGRQSGHFLEITSLILPQAALRRFPRFIRHRRRSDRSPRARSALAMTGFLARGVEKRGVQEAAPYGCMTGKCGAQGITDCHSQCTH